MSESINMGGFMGSAITLVFVFSTLYALAFFYFQAGGHTAYGNPLDEGGVANTIDKPLIDVFGIFEAILNFISLLSPFIFIKLFLQGIMQTSVPVLYQVLDLLVLRPVGWICSGFTINYIISKIPTVSGE